MPRLIVFLVLVLLVGGGGFYLYQNLQKQPPKTTAQTTKATPSPATPQSSDPCEVLVKGSAEVPSLYKEGITWQQPTIAEYEVPLGTDIGSKVMTGCLSKTSADNESSRMVRSYYLEELHKRGWKVIVQGDAPFGGLDSHQKGDQYVVIELKVNSNFLDQMDVALFYTQ